MSAALGEARVLFDRLRAHFQWVATPLDASQGCGLIAL